MNTVSKIYLLTGSTSEDCLNIEVSVWFYVFVQNLKNNQVSIIKISMLDLHSNNEGDSDSSSELSTTKVIMSIPQRILTTFLNSFRSLRNAPLSYGSRNPQRFGWFQEAHFEDIRNRNKNILVTFWFPLHNCGNKKNNLRASDTKILPCYEYRNRKKSTHGYCCHKNMMLSLLAALGCLDNDLDVVFCYIM